jgi:hypothetical protein
MVEFTALRPGSKHWKEADDVDFLIGGEFDAV